MTWVRRSRRDQCRCVATAPAGGGSDVRVGGQDHQPDRHSRRALLPPCCLLCLHATLKFRPAVTGSSTRGGQLHKLESQDNSQRKERPRLSQRCTARAQGTWTSRLRWSVRCACWTAWSRSSTRSPVSPPTTTPSHALPLSTAVTLPKTLLRAWIRGTREALLPLTSSGTCAFLVTTALG